MVGPIDPQAFWNSAGSMQDQGHAIVNGVSDLCGTLTGCDRMSGSNSAGVKFAGSYDLTANSILKACVAVAHECGVRADFLNTNGTNYFNAESASHATSPTKVGVRPFSDISFTIPSIPLASGGEGGTPSWWYKVEGILKDLWPDAGVDKLNKAKDGWNDLATKLDNAASGINGAINALHSSQNMPTLSAWETVLKGTQTRIKP